MDRLIVTVLAAVAASVSLPQPSQAGNQVCVAPRPVRAVLPATAQGFVPVRQTRPDESGEVIFTVAATTGSVMLAATGGDLTVEKVTDGQTVHVRLEAGGDVVRIVAGAAGIERVARGRKAIRLTPGAFGDADVQRAQRLLRSSRALRQFDLMAAVLADSTRPEAESVLASHALIRALVGDALPARALARRTRDRHAARARFAAVRSAEGIEPGMCWDIYSKTVNRYWNEMDECGRRSVWNPVEQAACGIQWTIQVELAWFWVISCSGGMPVI